MHETGGVGHLANFLASKTGRYLAAKKVTGATHG